MKRLIINSLLNATLLALLMYLFLRTIVALAVDRDIEFSELHLIAFSAFLGALRFSVMLPVDLYHFRTYRRLQRHFRIEDGFGKPGCWRSVTLVKPWSDFAKRAQVIITESLRTHSVTGDSAGGNITFDLFFGYAPYKIRFDAVGGSVVRISARHSHFLAFVMPVDLGAIQLVAGLVQWAADRGLTERDVAPSLAPERIEKDIGDWLSTPVGCALREETAAEAPKLFRPRFLVRGFLIRSALCVGAFLILYLIDLFNLMAVPLAIRLLPLFVIAVYAQAHVVRTYAGKASSDRTRGTGRKPLH